MYMHVCALVKRRVRLDANGSPTLLCDCMYYLKTNVMYFLLVLLVLIRAVTK